MDFNFKNVLIYGYSESGKAAQNVLKALKINYKIYDDKLKLKDVNCLKRISRKTMGGFDLVILSPGVSIYHKNIVKIKKMEIPVISELEFGFYFCKNKIIAVTGTNGKTTTSGLIAHMLNENGYRTALLGNIGTPLSTIFETNPENLDYVVVEVSSFQLEAIEHFAPHMAVLLNLDEDHLDRHKTFSNYIQCKLNLFKNMAISNLAVLNMEDPVIRKHSNIIAGTHVYTGAVDGCFAYEDTIFFKEEKICAVSELTINTFITNILAAIVVGKQIGLSNESMVAAMNTFKTEDSRFQFVKEVNGIKFINDSKATNVHAVKHAVSRINQPVTLLLGGQDKNLDFGSFFAELPPHIVNTVCFGKARNKIYSAAKKVGVTALHKCKSLTEAVTLSYNLGTEVVLLSPGCTSFDAYKNYAERGQHFISLVEEISKKEKTI